MANRDGLAIKREAREEIAKSLLIAEFAVMHQEHDSHGCELLAERGEPEIGMRVDFMESAQV